MKALILLVSIVFSIQLTFSNTKFDTIISHSADEEIFDIVEFDNFYILAGDIHIDTATSSYIVKIDKNGNFIKDTIIDYPSMARRIFKMGDEAVLFRTNYTNTPFQANFIYTKIDTSLNIVYEKILPMPAGLFEFRCNVIINSDSDFVIAGSTDIYSTSFPELNVFLYKVSSTGDSINSIFLNSPISGSRICYDVAEKDKKYFAFVNTFISNCFGNFLVIDSNLNILDTVTIPDNLWENYSPKLINDSIFVICTRKFDSLNIYITKIDETGQILKSKGFGKNNSLAWPCYQNSLAISNDHIYFLAISDFSKINPIYGNGASSSLMAGKLDLDMNTIWLKFIGGDYYYHAFNIKATSDGGCILVGTFNDTVNHNYNKDLFIIKLDSNGIINWDRTITIPKTTVKIFPNPVSDFLNLSTNAINDPINSITIYNIQGKAVSQLNINSYQTEINVSALSKGIYIIEGITRSGAVFREKFVKTP